MKKNYRLKRGNEVLYFDDIGQAYKKYVQSQCKKYGFITLHKIIGKIERRIAEKHSEGNTYRFKQ